MLDEERSENLIIEVIVGTYEDILIGYHVGNVGDKYTLEQTFANQSHCGSIRSIAVSSRYLASGSTDESVKLFNLKSRSEIGALFQQEGTITSLRFHQNSHLFSGSEDGSICIWKPGNWECLRTLRGHKDSVTALAVHPSGKLALSSSKDKTLKTWNLIKGRVAFTTNIKAVADIIEFSPDGSLYAVVVVDRVYVYSIESAGIIHTIDFARKVNALLFVNDTTLALGGDGENIEFHAGNKKAVYCIFPTGMNRIKGLNCISSPDGKSHWLLASSSSGTIKIWTLNISNLDEEPTLLTQANTGCRITCQAVSRRQLKAEEEQAKNVVEANVETASTKRKKCNPDHQVARKKGKAVNIKEEKG